MNDGSNMDELMSLASKKYVIKFGALRALHEDTGSLDSPPDTWITDLYEALDGSANVMEVKPADPEALKEAGFSVRHYVGTPIPDALTRAIHIRVALGKRQASEIYPLAGAFEHEHTAEQFDIFFNGWIYAAAAEVDRIGAPTNVGQLARELLKSLLGSQGGFSIEDFGPAPIHPDFYLLLIPDDDETSPGVQLKDRDLVLWVPEVVGIDELLSFFVGGPGGRALDAFFMAMAIGTDSSELAQDIRDKAADLNAELAKHFALSYPRRLFSRHAGSLRRVMAELHSHLLMFSDVQAEFSSRADETREAIASSPVFEELRSYFDEHLDKPVTLDRTTLLRMMNFVSEETNSAASAQAALIAATLGAFAGGSVALALRALFEAMGT